MTQAIASNMDYFARALFQTPDMTEALAVKYNENGKPVVYPRRWAILAAYSMTYFWWNVSASRQTPLIAEYALFHDTTNEFNGFDEPGIDFMYIFGAILLVFFYPIAGVFVDKYGLGVMGVGSSGIALAAWWWFFAGNSYYGALTSRILANFGGSLNASSLLRLTNNWFDESQRPTAVAIGSMVATIGSGAALLYGPLFSTGPLEVNFDIKSCDVADTLSKLNQTATQVLNITVEEIEGLECTDQLDVAVENFCCAAPTDINGLNLSIALITTLVAIFTVLVAKDAPRTPPSKAGAVRKPAGVWESLKLIFSKRNYNQICLADFCATGPVNLVFATVDRIFPPTVSDLSTGAAALGLLLAIPSAAFFARRLAKYKEYYELTAAGYSMAAVCFVAVALLMLVEKEATDYMVMGLVIIAVIFSVMWTVSVYELKIEYTFSPKYALQGYIVSTDRTIINFSAVTFLFAIPPERFKGDRLDGRQFSFLISALFVVIGAILALTIKDKKVYLREQYEQEKRVSVADLMDYEEDIDKKDIDKAKERRASRRRSSMMKRETEVEVVKVEAEEKKEEEPVVKIETEEPEVKIFEKEEKEDEDLQQSL